VAAMGFVVLELICFFDYFQVFKSMWLRDNASAGSASAEVESSAEFCFDRSWSWMMVREHKPNAAAPCVRVFI